MRSKHQSVKRTHKYTMEGKQLWKVARKKDSNHGKNIIVEKQCHDPNTTILI